MDVLPGFRFTAWLGPVAMGFQSMSGARRSAPVETYQEGGLNDRVHVFTAPATDAGTLRMEKGAYKGIHHLFYLVGESLPLPLTVIVSDGRGLPGKTYLFTGCVIKSWEVDGLDAAQNGLLIDRFEVAYEAIQVL